MKKTDITISWFLLGLLTLITAYIFIFPMLWGISTSLKSEVEFLDVESWGIIPKISPLSISFICLLNHQ